MHKGIIALTLGINALCTTHAVADPVRGEKAPYVLKGKVVDAKTGESIIGAAVYFKNKRAGGAMTGLDGSFRLETDVPSGTLIYSCIGYKTRECIVTSTTDELSLSLEETSHTLGEATVLAHNPGRTEAGARNIERFSTNVMNVMSAKAIELSPDLTVAGALSRMSGITMERNASGEGQYAILRGMDKRYNYTLVNGAKISSPDNKNRFVPLDIFPAEMLDRLEVTKSLTADMEGDGIGGAVNMEMKDAPDRRLFTINASTGYSAMFMHRSFATFGGSEMKKSPNERHGTDYAVSMADFTTRNLALKSAKIVPDFTAGLSFGDRYFGKRLGLIAAVSAQNNHRGKESNMYYDRSNATYGYTTRREYSEQQTRLGAHLKLDYPIAEGHRLAWYNGYMHFRNQQVRDMRAEKEETIRLRLNNQGIFNSTLTGTHTLLDDALTFDWRAVYSNATNRTPDNAQIRLTTASTGVQTVAVNPGMTRRWEHNSDADLAAYANLSYHLATAAGPLKLQAGGMYRDKQRSSFYNEYTFKPSAEQRTLVRGRDWTNFDEITWEAPRFGNLSDPLNYDATEKVGAAYAMAKLESERWHFTFGLRAEHTDQGYFLKFPTAGARNEGNQRYWDFLPDAHIKYEVHTDANLRFSYARAINRPSFFEIVPYNIINEDYKERGNPDLKHTVADNFDFRYEWFPRPSEQLMAAFFFKRIENPIEYGMETSGQDTYYMPENYGTAYNFGIELDFTKYFNRFGVKANYTYTHSSITTNKTIETANPDPDAETTVITQTVEQTRPLFGQAAHVVNFSILYKDVQRGWDAQLAFSYTGKQLIVVSRFLNNDSWQDGYPQLDASVEKRFGTSGWSIFAKANNILNLPLVEYIEKNSRNEALTDAVRHKGGVLERKERHGSNFLLGVRFKL